MRLLIPAFVATLIVLPSSVQKAYADPEECREAIDQYKMAIDDISPVLKRYAGCVSDSRGHDDRSSEFRRLRSAQDDFESAVSSYESECN
jgi:hypothetical protein